MVELPELQNDLLLQAAWSQTSPEETPIDKKDIKWPPIWVMRQGNLIHLLLCCNVKSSY